MSGSVSTSAQFASLEGARRAKARLVRAGFARNSIDILREGNTFEVSITTREDNIRHVERLLNHSPVGSDLLLAREQIAQSLRGSAPLALGLAALAGAGLFHLLRRH